MKTFVRGSAAPGDARAAPPPRRLPPPAAGSASSRMPPTPAPPRRPRSSSCEKGVAARAKVVEIVKTLCDANAAEWGRFEFEETKIGRLDHKIEKLQIVKLVPGVEWLHPDGAQRRPRHHAGGIHAVRRRRRDPPDHAFGPDARGNIINIVAAGNAVVFNPHPGGARCAALAVRAYNEAIHARAGHREPRLHDRAADAGLVRRALQGARNPPAVRHRRPGRGRRPR